MSNVCLTCVSDESCCPVTILRESLCLAPPLSHSPAIACSYQADDCAKERTCYWMRRKKEVGGGAGKQDQDQDQVQEKDRSKRVFIDTK